MEWDDLRFLLTVADSGGDVPQLERKHITALETALNCQLVVWAGGHATLTASGQRAVDAARAIASQIAALAKELGGERGELTGKVCVTSTATFVQRAMKQFMGLRTKYPALEIDVMVSSQVVDLRSKEADIAVRMFRDQQPGLAMHKLGTIGWSLYATRQYLADHEPDRRQLIAYDASFSNTAGGRWLAANTSEQAIAMRVSGIRPALDAAAAHRGACIVPCYLGVEHGLQRATDQVLTTNEVYAVYLAERSHEARLRVVIDALVEMFARDHAVFSGMV